MTDYKTILKHEGYLPAGGCSCGGVKQEKFKRYPYTVVIYIRKQTFRIKRDNSFITPSKPLTCLHEALAAQTIGVN